MRKRNITMKEVMKNKLLYLFLFCISNTYTQPFDREKWINSIIDNTSIDFELKVKNKDYVLLEITNTTNDTLSVRISLPVDKDDYSLYIAGYKKKYFNNKGKDSIYYQWGALSTRYTFGPNARMLLFEKKGEKPWLLFPKEKILTPLGVFYKGEYYVKIQTIYFRKNKKYMVRKETNHIVIE